MHASPPSRLGRARSYLLGGDKHRHQSGRGRKDAGALSHTPRALIVADPKLNDGQPSFAQGQAPVLPAVAEYAEGADLALLAKKLGVLPAELRLVLELLTLPCADKVLDRLRRPAHELGPQGWRVDTFLDAATELTGEQAWDLAYQRACVPASRRRAALARIEELSEEHGRVEERLTARDFGCAAARQPHLDSWAHFHALGDIAEALLLSDVLEAEHMETLYHPWERVVETFNAENGAATVRQPGSANDRKPA